MIREGELFTLKRRGGIIGERLVKSSLTPPKTRHTNPTTRNAIVSLDDPGSESLHKGVKRFIGKMTLTGNLAFIESKQNKNDSTNYQQQSYKVKVVDVFPEGPSAMRIEIQVKEQYRCCNTACWSKANRVR